MAFRLYKSSVRGRVQTQAGYLASKKSWTPAIYAELDEALGHARLAIEGGEEIPWEIEGDDGTSISRPEIIRILNVRRKELADRPLRT